MPLWKVLCRALGLFNAAKRCRRRVRHTVALEVSYALTYVAMQVDMPISGLGTPEQAAVVDILTRSDARAMECRRC